jgi:hypothetical protein
MKTLLDENIDARFKAALASAEVYTVREMGWLGAKNGVLHAKMETEGFKALVTAGKNMPFQQNLATLTFAIVIMDTPSLLFEHQARFLPKIQHFLASEHDPMPRIVHITVEGISKSSKIDQFKKLVPPQDFLLL